MDKNKLIKFGIAVIVVFAAILYMSVQWGRIDELKKMYPEMPVFRGLE